MSHYYISILQGALLTVAVRWPRCWSLPYWVCWGPLPSSRAAAPLVWLATLYTTVVRGIPELVLMLLVFYGAAIGINNLFEAMGSDYVLDLNPFVAGVATLGFIYGPTWPRPSAAHPLDPQGARWKRPGPLAWGRCAPFCASPCRKWCATPCPATPTTGWC